MPKQDYYLRTTCRTCASNDISKVMALTPTPPGNNFLKEDELDNPEERYPLDLYFCDDCGHVQLGHVVDPSILYQRNYSYVSATSAHFVAHLKDYAADMIKRFDLPEGALVADIGSNDGTCLRFFQEAGLRVLGVDPATNIADLASQSGIETVGDFFTFSLAQQLRDQHGPAGFITSHNACAHIDDLDDVVKGVEHWLADDGLFVLEVGYFYDVYCNVWFDTIYHEHLDYHTVGPLTRLFERFGMEVIQVERISPQGGSIRVITQKQGGKHSPDETVDTLIKLEQQAGLYDKQTFIDFDSQILNVRDQLLVLLKGLKKKGCVIAGYGAPTKATTLMSHFKLGKEILDFIVDDNPLKQGLYAPATHIPVLPAEAIYERRPDYVLILAWNFAEPVMKIHEKYSNEIGEFILPMPVPKIV